MKKVLYLLDSKTLGYEFSEVSSLLTPHTPTDYRFDRIGSPRLQRSFHGIKPRRTAIAFVADDRLACVV